MTEPNLPLPPQSAQPYILTDAFGRTYPSSAPAPVAHPSQVQAGLVPSCGCSHAPAASARSSAMSPGAMVAAGAVGALVVGVILVALLLSVAVVAVAVAVVAVSLTLCAVVLRSMTRDSARLRRGPHGI
ncbi:hypothetical protein ACFV3F_39270 [Streptomyces sp. NPDC059717]|uniref:hypothetical protein n=1 Tax=Streptomyces sp. NPDC059717 TaxID=3346922 RepID=UPI0036A0A482